MVILLITVIAFFLLSIGNEKKLEHKPTFKTSGYNSKEEFLAAWEAERQTWLQEAARVMTELDNMFPTKPPVVQAPVEPPRKHIRELEVSNGRIVDPNNGRCFTTIGELLSAIA